MWKSYVKLLLLFGGLLISYVWMRGLDFYGIACVLLVLIGALAISCYLGSEDSDALEQIRRKPNLPPLTFSRPNPFHEVKLKQLRAMDPFAFERYIAILLQTLGHSDAYATQEGEDGGKDVIFTDPSTGKKYYSECKRYAENNPVGRPIIQKLVGSALADDAIPYAVFTTGRFTQEALVEAEKTGVKCIGPRQLMQLIEKANLLHEEFSNESSVMV